MSAQFFGLRKPEISIKIIRIVGGWNNKHDETYTLENKR
jgi:hypothetical protein